MAMVSNSMMSRPAVAHANSHISNCKNVESVDTCTRFTQNNPYLSVVHENCAYGRFSEKLSIYQRLEDKLKSHGRSLLVSALFHVTEDLCCTVVNLLLL